jgi:hypothetical protein
MQVVLLSDTLLTKRGLHLQVFLYVTRNKRVGGFLVAETITSANPVIASASAEVNVTGPSSTRLLILFEWTKVIHKVVKTHQVPGLETY